MLLIMARDRMAVRDTIKHLAKTDTPLPSPLSRISPGTSPLT